jgi:hypothetical protein
MINVVVPTKRVRELSQNQRRRILDSLRLLFRKATFDLKQTEMR